MITKEELTAYEQRYIRNNLLSALGQQAEEITLNEIMNKYNEYIRENKNMKNDIAIEFEMQNMFNSSVVNVQKLLLTLKSMDLSVKKNTAETLIDMLEFRLKITGNEAITEEETKHITDAVIQALALEKAYTTASYLFLNILGLGVKQEELKKPKYTFKKESVKRFISEMKTLDEEQAIKIKASFWLYENYCFDIPYIAEMGIVDSDRREVKKTELDRAKENETFEKMVQVLQSDFYEILPRMKGVFENEETRA